MAQVHEIAAQAAAEVNPDGWAADPEAVLAGVIEHLFEYEHFNGVVAACEEARRVWKQYNAQFHAAEGVVMRGYYAEHVLETEKVGAALAARVKEGSA